MTMQHNCLCKQDSEIFLGDDSKAVLRSQGSVIDPEAS